LVGHGAIIIDIDTAIGDRVHVGVGCLRRVRVLQDFGVATFPRRGEAGGLPTVEDEPNPAF